MMAASTHQIHPTALYGIYTAEGGKVGMANLNTNGSYDLGPMQINTIWLPALSKRFDMSEEKVEYKLKNDACFNVDTAAIILKDHLKNEPDFLMALGNYHSKTPKHNRKYRTRILKNLKREGLIK